MSENTMYRVAADGVKASRTYELLSSARNFASNRYGGFSWEGLNSQVINRRFYNWQENIDVTKDVKYTIQKLTPAFKQIHPSGAFQLSLEWVDLGE